MIVACVALLVALGGTSVAAVSQLARNSVGTLQLRNGAVTNVKMRNNAINSAKVANRSLRSVDFAPGQLPAGPTGPQGPAGPAGPAGAAGPAGVIGAITVRTNFVSVPAGGVGFQSERVTASCQSNERAISAGTSWGDDDPDLELFVGEFEPLLTQGQVTAFRAVGVNGTTEAQNFSVHVLCYTP
jgi:hypothetical protein